MRSHFLGSLCRFLNRRGILTHPRPLYDTPCRDITEFVEAWRIVPRWLVIWRVRRTLRIVYPTNFARMRLVSAKSYDQTMPKRGLRWHVTYTAGCKGVDE
jgi:hypothetical protein